MNIVLYFSAAFGIFWLIHGVSSHNESVAKRNSVQRSNASKDTVSEYSFSKPADEQNKVLIKSESPLRGRKIHQTAWSKEESDGGTSEEMTITSENTFQLESSWTMEKLLKYLMSFVYEMDEKDVPSHIWITSEVIKDRLEQNNDNTKDIQKSTKTEKNKDGISHKREHSFKKGDQEDYYETLNRKQAENDISYENDESFENSNEYEEQVANFRKFKNINIKHTVQDNKEYRKSRAFIIADQSSSQQSDEIADSEECFEDIDVNQKQNSEEIENMKTTGKKNISKNKSKEQFNEDKNYKTKQEIISNKKHKTMKDILQNTTEKDGFLTSKENHKIIVLNGTTFTGQDDESNRNDVTETSIARNKSKAELSNTKNNVNEETSELLINEHQTLHIDSYMDQELGQNIKNVIQNASISQNSTKKDIADSIFEQTQHSSNDIDENANSFAEKSEHLNEQQEIKSSLREIKQTFSRDDTFKNEVMKTVHTGQNDEVIFASSPINITVLDLDKDNESVLKIHPEILTGETRQEITAIFNEETLNNPTEMQANFKNMENQNGENKEFEVQNIPKFEIPEMQIKENYEERTERYEDMSHQNSQNSIASVTENHLQNYEYSKQNLNAQENETPLVFIDNAYEYHLEGNEFIQLNGHNEENHNSNYDMDFNNHDSESENISQLLTDSLVPMLQYVQQADEQQETFDTILEFLYKHSKNPLILSLKENSNSTK